MSSLFIVNSHQVNGEKRVWDILSPQNKLVCDELSWQQNIFDKYFSCHSDTSNQNCWQNRLLWNLYIWRRALTSFYEIYCLTKQIVVYLISPIFGTIRILARSHWNYAAGSVDRFKSLNIVYIFPFNQICYNFLSFVWTVDGVSKEPDIASKNKQ